MALGLQPTQCQCMWMLLLAIARSYGTLKVRAMQASRPMISTDHKPNYHYKAMSMMLLVKRESAAGGKVNISC
eukprot:1158955-Pelagomonas_calceolata.AAC.9